MKTKVSFAVIAFFGLMFGLPGSVAGIAQAPVPYRLTLQDAIQKALQANLGALVAETRVAEAVGTRERRFAAAWLPRVTAQTYANVQNRDLRAFGISIPGMPEVVGPFSNYDVRLYAQQNLIDLASSHGLKASERALDAEKLSDRDTRDMIVRAIASLYLDAQTATARVEAAESRVADSEALFKLASDRHQAGTATGVDVLRAQVQLANDRQSLLVAQNQYRQSLLVLARNLGLNPDTPFELADELRFTAIGESQPETLIARALLARADYLSLAAQRQSLVEQQRASHARNYPKLTVNGNFGGIGRSVGGMQGTGAIQGQIDFTIFDRDRDGEAKELESRVRRIDDQIDDLRRGIDQEIREALLNLQSAAEQVGVAKEGQDLAHRELDLTRDRFQQGTANNVEVVTAQDELARAEENYILAVSTHVDAKFGLARALGDMENNAIEFGKKE
jgi:outer membrane protein TolC